MSLPVTAIIRLFESPETPLAVENKGVRSTVAWVLPVPVVPPPCIREAEGSSSDGVGAKTGAAGLGAAATGVGVAKAESRTTMDTIAATAPAPKQARRWARAPREGAVRELFVWVEVLMAGASLTSVPGCGH